VVNLVKGQPSDGESVVLVLAPTKHPVRNPDRQSLRRRAVVGRIVRWDNDSVSTREALKTCNLDGETVEESLDERGLTLSETKLDTKLLEIVGQVQKLRRMVAMLLVVVSEIRSCAEQSVYCWNMLKMLPPPCWADSRAYCSKYWKMIVTASRIPVPDPMAPMKSAKTVSAPMHIPPNAAAIGM